MKKNKWQDTTLLWPIFSALMTPLSQPLALRTEALDRANHITLVRSFTAEHLGPVFKGQIFCDNPALTFVGRADHSEQQFRSNRPMTSFSCMDFHRARFVARLP